MAAFALPELLPNKWRHIGVVIADFTVYIAVILGPVTARFGQEFGTWEWNFWSVAIFQGLSFFGLLFLYFPPARPYVLPISPLANDVLMVAFVKVLEFLAGKLSSPWTTSVCLLIPLSTTVTLC